LKSQEEEEEEEEENNTGLPTSIQAKLTRSVTVFGRVYAFSAKPLRETD